MHKCGAPDTPEAFVSVSRTSSWRQQLERAAGPTRSTHACASAAGSAGSVGQIERAARRRAARTPPRRAPRAHGATQQVASYLLPAATRCTCGSRHPSETPRTSRSESARSCRGAAQIVEPPARDAREDFQSGTCDEERAAAARRAGQLRQLMRHLRYRHCAGGEGEERAACWTVLRGARREGVEAGESEAPGARPRWIWPPRSPGVISAHRHLAGADGEHLEMERLCPITLNDRIAHSPAAYARVSARWPAHRQRALGEGGWA